MDRGRRRDSPGPRRATPTPAEIASASDPRAPASGSRFQVPGSRFCVPTFQVQLLVLTENSGTWNRELGTQMRYAGIVGERSDRNGQAGGGVKERVERKTQEPALFSVVLLNDD